MLKSKNFLARNIVLTFILLILLSSIFMVREGSNVLMVRLGKLVGSSASQTGTVYSPGINFKIPFLDKVMVFDTRLQTFEQKSSRILTKQQKYVLVDYYVKWRINNLPLYFKRNFAGYSYGSGNLARGTLESLLSQKINNALRAEFGQHSITEVISGERSNIMSTLLDLANSGAMSLGVEVVDVRIKRIDLPMEVSQSVFERMRADRERVATKHRSNGHSQAEVLRAKADAEVTIIGAEANAKSAAIKAKGDGLAAKIYNDAFTKNAGFYELYRSLQAYVNTFKKNRDLIVLRTNSSYFKFFKNPVNN